MNEATFYVSNLADARSLYETILWPLRYSVISTVTHELESNQKTKAIALGPTGSRRVDLWLSESSRSSWKVKAEAKAPCLCFHAVDRQDVESFHAAARATGIRVVQPPQHHCDGRYHVIVQDNDGNRIEAACSDPDLNIYDNDDDPIMRIKDAASEDDSKIQHWMNNMSPQQTYPTVADVTGIRRPFTPTTYAPSPNPYPSYATTMRPSTTRPRRSSPPGSHRDLSVKDIITGAATAGVVGALAYGLVKEVNDSKERETDFNEAIRRADEADAEAQAHVRKTTRRRKTGSRDSGYYSIESVTTTLHTRKSSSPPAKSTRREEHPRTQRTPARGTTYPQPSRHTERLSEASIMKPRRDIEAGHASDRSSRRHSEPPGTDKRSHISSSQAPSKPSRPMPPPGPSAYREPESRPRRSSMSQMPTSTASSSTVKKLPYYSTHDKAPSQSATKGSRKTASRDTQSTSVAQSASFNHAARDVPLPASTDGSRRTTSTVRTARGKPLPRSVANSALDHLASVTCDDSISNVGSHRGGKRTSAFG